MTFAYQEIYLCSAIAKPSVACTRFKRDRSFIIGTHRNGCHSERAGLDVMVIWAGAALHKLFKLERRNKIAVSEKSLCCHTYHGFPLC